MDIFKNYKFWIAVAVAILGIYFFIIKPNMTLNELKKENETLKKEVLAKDTLQKLTEGKYSKLVDNFNTASGLNKILSDSMKTISDSIKNRKERVLYTTQDDITFKNKKDSSKIEKTSNAVIYNFSSYYPTREKPFIQLNGTLNTGTLDLKENWKFNTIKLNMVVTERKDGLWDSYIDAPEFVTVNSLKVNALPADKFVPKAEQTKTFGLYGGLGVRGMSDFGTANKDLLIKTALTIKDSYMIQADYGTDRKIGVGVLFKF